MRTMVTGEAYGGEDAWKAGAGMARPPGPRLLLIGLAPDLAEPVTLLADLLGWRVAALPAGPVMRLPADLCMAMLPHETSSDPGTACAATRPPLAVWSPNSNLNEHIFQSGRAIMAQPPCIHDLEQLLLTCGDRL